MLIPRNPTFNDRLEEINTKSVEIAAEIPTQDTPSAWGAIFENAYSP